MVNKNIGSTSRAKPTIQQRTSASIQNNFTGGLKTEFTGLNFPENACTSVDNCVFTIIGDVLRREGINFENNYALQNINTTGQAISYYRWVNAGGDGQTQLFVLQVGVTLYFFETSNATASSGASAQLLGSTVMITAYQALGNTDVLSNFECNYATGNGYLFVFHRSCDPFYCTFTSGIVTPNLITVQIRDFLGIPEVGTPSTFRPTTLTPEHQYNLQNQGWGGNPSWTTTSSTVPITSQVPGQSGFYWYVTPGSQSFSVASGLTVSTGETVTLTGYITSFFSAGAPPRNVPLTLNGILQSYGGSTMTIYITTTTDAWVVEQGGIPAAAAFFTITPTNTNLINTWHSVEGNYPSNSDIWFQYKDTSNVFNPSVTVANVFPGNAQAPQGHYILSAFNQNRSAASGVNGLTNIRTTTRPAHGAWFQGRIWYSGLNASQAPTGDAQFYTWTENIYFSQVIVDVTDFGSCYQENDPTDENLFDELPTDGGVITIPGTGAIYKLFPMQNGMLVFAANGVWFIRGNSGLGFTANDYSINKISAVQSISTTSFVDIQGLPMFWNEEGIYAVEPSQGQSPYGYGGLTINPITVGTILSFYNNIPLDSKRYARGDYDPISYVISWVYRSTDEVGISNRYQFDSVLNLNVYNRAFYPYSISSNNNCFICGLFYLSYPSGSLDPSFKYLTAAGTKFTLSEENDDVTYLDWHSFDNTGVNYISSFITGYQIKGQALTKFQPMYVYIYSRNDTNTGYLINSIWDYASSNAAGKTSTQQKVTNALGQFGMVYRRHRLRGRGIAFQIQIQSIQGVPFDIMGWTVLETISGSV